jgi:murein DD-endopeptidase MepM/ murein hydrolase activator NlpD
MNKPFVAGTSAVRSFTAKASILLTACAFGLLLQSVSAAPAPGSRSAASAVASRFVSGSASTFASGSASAGAFATAVSALDAHKKVSGKTAQGRLSHRKSKGAHGSRIVFRSGKVRRLSARMAAAILRTKEREERELGKRTVSVTLEKTRGRMSWPVESKSVLVPFGMYRFMVGITANNKGVTIGAEEGSDVRAVGDGQVQEVFPELDAVMVCHGDYFTTYSNLSAITVCKGDAITAGQILGVVGTGGRIDFWLSDKVRMLDPERWLRR